MLKKQSSIRKLTIFLCAMVFGFGITQAAESIIYDFTDGTIIENGTSADGALTLSGQYGLHGSQYGMNMKVDGTISIAVDGSCSVSFLGSAYSSLSVMGTASEEGDLGTISSKVETDLGESFEFTYTGSATTLTFKTVLTDGAGSDLYLPSITLTPIESIPNTNGKTEVWDFGAEQLDTNMYSNILNPAVINAWYDASVEAGSKGSTLPNFTEGVLTFIGGGSDRLRSTNTELTRYDENISSSTYTGRIYINKSSTTDRYFKMMLNENDEISVAALSQNGQGLLNFVYADDPSLQTDAVSITADEAVYKFVAKQTGAYLFYDTQDKPSYFRFTRKTAEYASVSGNIDITAAQDIPEGYSVAYTNEAGKSWTATVSEGTYNISIPLGYTYKISLIDANGYIITSSASLDVTEATETNNISIKKINLNTLTGTITGLGSDLSKLAISIIPVDETKIFVPNITINQETGEYSAELEPNTEYTILAEGVNDYEVTASSITITADQSADIAFTAKPTYNVTIETATLSEEQLAKLQTTFTNLNEEGYVYSFNSVDDIMLRDGVYSITTTGLDEYTIKQALTSNLKIEGANTTKELSFLPVTVWSFDDKVITEKDTAYKGLMLTSVKNQIAKGHLVCSDGGIIKVPVQAGDKITVSYYYQATFTVADSTITTSSGSTSTIESFAYTYEGTEAGYVTINVSGTSYLTSIEIGGSIPYTATLTVGTDKDYQTINGALDAVKKMIRPNNERVTIAIDPGNYEEMLVIDQKNVTLSNASATPTIALKNKGVDIDENAVRITSYYGHGYNYYSMSNDQKWHEDVLAVNKENGYISYENAGGGSTNGSYWNSTVVVFADGFTADNIIFENSFNQYISKKESEDVVEEWISGGKGTRPTEYGSTEVQNKSYIERACALAVQGGDKMILNNCHLVGHQDVFYGNDARVAVYKGIMNGGTDYIFGGMTVVFYESDFALNTSEDNNDVAYITAGQQGENERGYLMYKCNIRSAEPGVENAATYQSKPGYFGRAWSGADCEVVFYKTTINTTNTPSYTGQSLISAAGWKDGLGGPSWRVAEYGTKEVSGVDNSEKRLNGPEESGSWGQTVLSTPFTRRDTIAINPATFIAGNDQWSPFEDMTDVVLSDATLSSLEFSEGILTPSFNPAITNYTLKLEPGTSALTADAKAVFDNANVTVGNFSTLPGTDTIKVTDADGVNINYIITVDKEIITDTLSGMITGLNSALSELTLTFTSSNPTSPHTPSLTINTETGEYSVELESNVAYTLTAEGVNDYELSTSSITIAANESADIAFTKKPTYSITIDAPALTTEELAKMQISFTNINEEGYVYSFESIDNITLRKGVYSVEVSGVDNFVIDPNLTNLNVADSETTMTLTFTPVSIEESPLTFTSSYPNPVECTATVMIESNKTAGATIIVFDILGSTVFSTSQDITAGTNKLELDLNSLSAGTYFLQVSTGNDSETIRIQVK